MHKIVIKWVKPTDDIEAGPHNTSESDYKLYIQEADYILKGPIIYSRGRLYIQGADYIFLMALSHWSIHKLKSKLLFKRSR